MSNFFAAVFSHGKKSLTRSQKLIKATAFLTVLALIASVAVFVSGCGSNNPKGNYQYSLSLSSTNVDFESNSTKYTFPTVNSDDPGEWSYEWAYKESSISDAVAVLESQQQYSLLPIDIKHMTETASAVFTATVTHSEGETELTFTVNVTYDTRSVSAPTVVADLDNTPETFTWTIPDGSFDPEDTVISYLDSDVTDKFTYTATTLSIAATDLKEVLDIESFEIGAFVFETLRQGQFQGSFGINFYAAFYVSQSFDLDDPAPEAVTWTINPSASFYNNTVVVKYGNRDVSESFASVVGDTVALTASAEDLKAILDITGEFAPATSFMFDVMWDGLYPGELELSFFLRPMSAGTSNQLLGLTVGGPFKWDIPSGTFNDLTKITYEGTDVTGFFTKESETKLSITAADLKTILGVTGDFNAGTYTFETTRAGIYPGSFAIFFTSTCIAEGTLITLADGSQVPVEQLTGDELLLVWNHHTGAFEAAPILYIDSDAQNEYEIIHLYFSDGTDVKVIYEHGFWNHTLNRYVYITSVENVEYIGHWFNKQTVDAYGDMTWSKVQLTDVRVYNELTTAWSPATFTHMNYYVNGMLSLSGGNDGLINYFEVDADTLQYDQAAFQADIAEYGLFTYEDFAHLVPEIIFEAYQGQYLTVAMGKGMLTWEMLDELVEQFAYLLEKYQ